MHEHRTALGKAWRIYVPVSAATFVVYLLVSLNSPREHTVSAKLKLEFVTANGRTLTCQQYVDSGIGGGPWINEGATLISELCLREAYERLLPGAPVHEIQWQVMLARDRLRWTGCPDGIRVFATGKDPAETVKILNALLETYRDKRNQLAPAPPNCKALAISIVQPARTSGWSLAAPLLRAVLLAACLGLAVAAFLARKDHRFNGPAAPAFLSLFGLFFSAGLLSTPLALPVLWIGASFFALVFAFALGCLEIVSRLQLPFPRRLLPGTLIALGVFSALGAFVEFAVENVPRDFARIKLSVEQPFTQGESLFSYNPRFLETECAFLCSRLFASEVLKHCRLEDEDLSSAYSPASLEALLAHAVRVKPRPGSSIIDISVQRHVPGLKPLSPGQLLGVYRDCWTARSETNLTGRVTISVLDRQSRSSKIRKYESGLFYTALTNRLLIMTVVMVGVVCVGLLARVPGRLYWIACLATLYLLALGFGTVLNSLKSQAANASAVVRIWPTSANLPIPDAGFAHDPGPRLLERECKRATSDEVLGKTAEVLASNSVFSSREGMHWGKNAAQRKLWLHQRLESAPLGDAFLLRFTAKADDPKVAVEVANAAAEAYCVVRGAGSDKLQAEIMDRAFSHSSDPSATPLTSGLKSIAPFWLHFMSGVGIGFGGLLVAQFRRRRASRTFSSAT